MNKNYNDGQQPTEKNIISDLMNVKNSQIIFTLKAILNVVKRNVAISKVNYKFLNGFMVARNRVTNAESIVIKKKDFF